MREASLLPDLARQHIDGSLPMLKLADPKVTADHIRKVAKMGSDFHGRLAEIEADWNLTDQGKAEARRDAGKKTLLEADTWFVPLLCNFKKHEESVLEELSASMFLQVPNDTASRLESAMLRAEIRSTARGLDQAAIEILYRTGTPIVRAALEEIPNISEREGNVIQVPFITEELRHEVLMSEAREKLPEKVDALDDITAVRDILGGLVQTLTNEIIKEAPGVIDKLGEPVVT